MAQGLLWRSAADTTTPPGLLTQIPDTYPAHTRHAPGIVYTTGLSQARKPGITPVYLPGKRQHMYPIPLWTETQGALLVFRP